MVGVKTARIRGFLARESYFWPIRRAKVLRRGAGGCAGLWRNKIGPNLGRPLRRVVRRNIHGGKFPPCHSPAHVCRTDARSKTFPFAVRRGAPANKSPAHRHHAASGASHQHGQSANKEFESEPNPVWAGGAMADFWAVARTEPQREKVAQHFLRLAHLKRICR
jgi:hypothetical protein